MPANWNSYSKSDTALNPRKIILDLYLLHNFVVKELNEITIIFFLLNFKSLYKAFLTILILSSTVKRYFFWLLFEIATIRLSINLKDFLITSIWP